MPNDQPVQTFQNHTKFVPAFHFVVLPLLGINFVWTVVRLVKYTSPETVMAVVVAICLVMMALLGRLFAITVQDRVIRLEMQLRIRDVCPADLAARFNEFTRGQLVALRFASDAELPSLARKVLDERLEDRKAIKQMVKEWQPDNLRA
jgi:Family of unknown function (DUF6526)